MRYVSDLLVRQDIYISEKHHAVITDFRYTYQAEAEAEGLNVLPSAVADMRKPLKKSK